MNPKYGSEISRTSTRKSHPRTGCGLARVDDHQHQNSSGEYGFPDSAREDFQQGGINPTSRESKAAGNLADRQNVHAPEDPARRRHEYPSLRESTHAQGERRHKPRAAGREETTAPNNNRPLANTRPTLISGRAKPRQRRPELGPEGEALTEAEFVQLKTEGFHIASRHVDIHALTDLVTRRV